MHKKILNMTLIYFKDVKIRKRPMIMRYLQLTAF